MSKNNYVKEAAKELKIMDLMAKARRRTRARKHIIGIFEPSFSGSHIATCKRCSLTVTIYSRGTWSGDALNIECIKPGNSK